jgi:hypothetical protein
MARSTSQLLCQTNTDEQLALSLRCVLALQQAEEACNTTSYVTGVRGKSKSDDNDNDNNERAREKATK